MYTYSAGASGRMPQLGYLKGLLAEGKLSPGAYEKIVGGECAAGATGVAT